MYGQVQLRLPKVPPSKPALFKISQPIETIMDLLPACCSADELQYIIQISNMTCSTVILVSAIPIWIIV